MTTASRLYCISKEFLDQRALLFVFFVDFKFQILFRNLNKALSSLLRYNQVGAITQPVLALFSSPQSEHTNEKRDHHQPSQAELFASECFTIISSRCVASPGKFHKCLT